MTQTIGVLRGVTVYFMSTVATTPKRRVTRSISFERAVLELAKAKAKKISRTVNWYVNNLVKEDVEAGR